VIAKALDETAVLLAAHRLLRPEEDHAPIQPELAQEGDERRMLRQRREITAVNDRADGGAERLELEVEARDAGALEGHHLGDRLRD
jgi:hypothetical protein